MNNDDKHDDNKPDETTKVRAKDFFVIRDSESLEVIRQQSTSSTNKQMGYFYAGFRSN